MRFFQPRETDAEVTALLSRELGIHPVTAQILAARGYTSADDARRFLTPGPDRLHDPMLLRDMDRGVQEVDGALRDGLQIAIYGDYDVDGVCATAVLFRALGAMGGRVRAFIPHRVSEGYGLNGDALLRLKEEGCDLVVTVDNGTTRVDEVAAAARNGLAVVVTDHHEPGEALPDCAVINPKRADSLYPFNGLAGCGVAFKLVCALAQRRGVLNEEPFKALLPDLLALVAIGTVADVVPLTDENRSLVAMGLAALNKTDHPGLRALMDVSNCRDRIVRTTDIAFRLGPRINAAGRLDSAKLSLDLLLCQDPVAAPDLAFRLDEANRERQRLERRQSETAIERGRAALEKEDLPALVLADAEWHPGLIGIVAMRVAETCSKPVVCIAIDGDTARGSARSFGGVRLHEALAESGEHLLTHGGHAFAAGCTLRADRIDAFRADFLAAVARQPVAPSETRVVDAELPLEAVTAPLVQELDRLRPFGSGNAEPVFCAYGVRAAGRPRRMGNQDRHLSFYAANDRTSVRAVAFNQADSESILDNPIDLSFVVRARSGPDAVEIHVRKMLPSS